jgi:hypothetical protein
MLQWVVPQIMEAIDDEGVDVNRTLTRIIYGVMHHPAQRNMGNDGIQDGRQLIFRSVEEWWNGLGSSGQDDYRRKLSSEGVQRGENHKEGVQDTGHGHGCNGHLKMHKQFGAPETMEDRIAGAAAGAIMSGATSAFSGMVEQQTGYKLPTYKRPQEEESSGGGGFLGMASNILGGAFKQEESQSSGGYGGGSSYGRRNDDEGGYGGGSSYGRRNEDEGGYGGNSHGRRDEDEGGYGGGSGYGRRNEDEGGYGGDNYGRRNDEERRDDEGGGGLGDFISKIAGHAEEKFKEGRW